MADAGHTSGKLAREILRDEGWKLQIFKRQQLSDAELFGSVSGLVQGEKPHFNDFCELLCLLLDTAWQRKSLTRLLGSNRG